MTQKPSFLSLFSGCGGLDIGFVEAGFKCNAAFDIDKNAVDVHRANLGVSAHRQDLTKITKEQLLQTGRPTVVLAGSPCQGFSTAGKRELNDPRNSLLLHAGQLALSLQPKVFVAENVAGALSGEHRIYWQQLENILRHGGYSTRTLYVRGTNIGLAQMRKRIFMVAWNNNKNPQLELPDIAPKTLAEALEGVESLPQHEKIYLKDGSVQYQIARKIRRGQKLCNVRGGTSSVHTWDIPEVFGQTTDYEKEILKKTMRLRRTERLRNFGDADPVSIESLTREMGADVRTDIFNLIKKGYIRSVGDRFDLVNTFNGKYRRLDWNSASPTVDTRFGDARYFLHPSENRSFTVREAARIQGFPDWFRFLGKANDSFKMIGNAVPPPMARHIASLVRNIID